MLLFNYYMFLWSSNDYDIFNSSGSIRGPGKLNPGFIRIIDDMLNNINIPKYDLNSCLGEAMYGGHDELVKLLLDQKECDPMKGDMMYNYIHPASAGHFRTMKLILEHKQTDLSKKITLKWPMLDIDIENDSKLEITLRTAILCTAMKNEHKGRNDFISYFDKLK